MTLNSRYALLKKRFFSILRSSPEKNWIKIDPYYQRQNVGRWQRATKNTQTKQTNWSTHKTTQIKPKPGESIFHLNKLLICMCLLSLYNRAIDNTTWNRSDNHPSYPPDNRHSIRLIKVDNFSLYAQKIWYVTSNLGRLSLLPSVGW